MAASRFVKSTDEEIEIKIVSRKMHIFQIIAHLIILKQLFTDIHIASRFLLLGPVGARVIKYV